MVRRFRWCGVFMHMQIILPANVIASMIELRFHPMKNNKRRYLIDQLGHITAPNSRAFTFTHTQFAIKHLPISLVPTDNYKHHANVNLHEKLVVFLDAHLVLVVFVGFEAVLDHGARQVLRVAGVILLSQIWRLRRWHGEYFFCFCLCVVDKHLPAPPWKQS